MFRFAIAPLLVALVACQSPLPTTSAPSRGSLTLAVTDSVSRNLLPGLSMDVASYLVTGSGPSGATFTQTLTGTTSATVDALAQGPWTVTVEAENASGTKIGVGSGSATVTTLAPASVAVTVRPYDGYGTLDLSLTWPTAEVTNLTVEAGLLPTSGSERPLAFTLDTAAGTGHFHAADVPTGYHTLNLKLKDGTKVVAGAVEVVRIVKAQSTAGTYTFSEVNKATAALNVNVSPDLGEPLVVSLDGASPTKTPAQNLALTAGVLNYADNVTYTWYVNGEFQGTGQNFTFDSHWALGHYRVDVTAFSADGKRGGSATTDVGVESFVLSENIVLVSHLEPFYKTGSSPQVQVRHQTAPWWTGSPWDWYLDGVLLVDHDYYTNLPSLAFGNHTLEVRFHNPNTNAVEALTPLTLTVVDTQAGYVLSPNLQIHIPAMPQTSRIAYMIKYDGKKDFITFGPIFDQGSPQELPITRPYCFPVNSTIVLKVFCDGNDNNNIDIGEAYSVLDFDSGSGASDVYDLTTLTWTIATETFPYSGF